MLRMEEDGVLLIAKSQQLQALYDKYVSDGIDQREDNIGYNRDIYIHQSLREYDNLFCLMRNHRRIPNMAWLKECGRGVIMYLNRPYTQDELMVYIRSVRQYIAHLRELVYNDSYEELIS